MKVKIYYITITKKQQIATGLFGSGLLTAVTILTWLNVTNPSIGMFAPILTGLTAITTALSSMAYNNELETTIEE